MMTIKKTAANRIAIDWVGAIDSREMGVALDDLVTKSADVIDGQLLYKIHDFEMPSMGAIAAEFARMPQLFGLLMKFDRCAVLSDTPWLRTAAEMEGAIFPMLTIKSFELDEEEDAKRWLDGEDDDNLEAENFPV
jgi:hypothetical protein